MKRSLQVVPVNFFWLLIETRILKTWVLVISADKITNAMSNFVVRNIYNEYFAG